jgi:Zn-dependent metalloprotease
VRQNAALTFFGGDQTLVAQDSIVDADGTEHVRFARTYRGLRVIGGDLVVHGTSGGAFVGLSQTLSSPLTLATRASLASQGAVRQALRRSWDTSRDRRRSSSSMRATCRCWRMKWS